MVDRNEDITEDVQAKRQNLLALILVAAAVLVLGGVAVFTHISSSKAVSKNVASAAYKLTAPTGWKKIQPTPKGTLASFAAPAADTDSTGTLKAFVDVQSSALNPDAQKLPFDQIANTYVTQLSQSYGSYKQLGLVSGTVENLPAMVVTFSSVQGQTAVTTDALFMVKQNVSYVVNGESLSSTWSQHADDLKQSLLTFRP